MRRLAALGTLWWLLAAVPVFAQATVRVQWDPNTETDLAGYYVHVGQASGVYANTLNVGNTTLSPVIALPLPSTTYYFAVSAYNTSGLRSVLSNEVSMTTPPSPVPVTCTFSLSGPPTIGAGGGTGALSVQASDPSCAWTLSSMQPWLSVVPVSGVGTTMPSYNAQANPVAAARSATVSGPGSASWTLLQDAFVPPPQPPPDPCASAVPRITPGAWDNHFKLGSYGRILISDLDWTAEIGDRRIMWIETQLGAQPPVRISEAGVIATLTSLTYRSSAKGLFNLVVRAGDDRGCVGATGQARQVRVN